MKRYMLLTFVMLSLSACGSSSSDDHYQMSDELREKVEELKAMAENRESGMISVIVRFDPRYPGDSQSVSDDIEAETGLVAGSVFRSFAAASYHVTAEDLEALANLPQVRDIDYGAPLDSNGSVDQNLENVVYDNRVPVQCDEEEGLSLSESAQTLIDAGIDVLWSACGVAQGTDPADACGAPPALKYFHRVHDANVPDALEQGFEPARNEQDPDSDTGEPAHELWDDCP